MAFYRSLMKKVESRLGLSVGWGLHSPRAGFASDSRAEGWAFQEIREAGRWASDSSLRTYLDIVGATNVSVSLRAAGLAEALRAVAEIWPSYFREEHLRLAYAATGVHEGGRGMGAGSGHAE